MLGACVAPVREEPATSPAELGHGVTSAESANLQERFEKLVQAPQVAAASAALVRGGELVWTHGFGSADSSTGRLATAETLFHVASVSKTVTVCVVLQAMERGLLALDDDVNQYLPFAIRNPKFADQPITLRQLLTHSSSLRDNWDVFDSTAVLNADFPGTLAGCLADYFTPGGDLYDRKQNFESWAPGARSEYSNIGIALAAYIAERASGELFEDLAESGILRPLGMQHSSFRLSRLDLSQVAIPHHFQDGALEPIGHHGYMDFPAGTLRTSVVEMSLFLRCIMNGGALGKVRILQPETVDQMLQIQDSSLDPTQGLVWFREPFGEQEYWGHNGGDPGVSTNMWFREGTDDGFLFFLTGRQSDQAELDTMEFLRSALGD